MMQKTLTDAEYVARVYGKDRAAERGLHLLCKRYFDENYRGLFSRIDDESRDDIFQEAFITLWNHILDRRIYVADGVLTGKDGKPFRSRLTTYFMGIARLKYLEWLRKRWQLAGDEETEIRQISISMEDYTNADRKDDCDAMQVIMDDCMSSLPSRCAQILTMFYYKMKTLDEIMGEVPEFESKDALKTRKYKCMSLLRDRAESRYRSYFNA